MAGQECDGHPMLPLAAGHRAVAGRRGRACRLALLALSPDGVWVAFPLYFLQLRLLPRRAGWVAVAATAAAAIAGFAAHQHSFSLAMAIGPALGAAVAVAVVWGYQALSRESEHRRQLIEELTTTRADLAAAQHTAGALAEATAWPARSTTPSPRASPASSCCCAPPDELFPTHRGTPPATSSRHARRGAGGGHHRGSRGLPADRRGRPCPVARWDSHRRAGEVAGAGLLRFAGSCGLSASGKGPCAWGA